MAIAYNPVPTVEPQSAATPYTAPMRVHATEEAFGGQIGQAEQKLGGAVEGIGKDLSDYAIKQQGLINETAMTSAEAQLIEKNAALKGDFLSKEGMEAHNALPSYLKSLDDNYTSIRSTLPAGAVRGFDMLAMRQKANYASDATQYAMTQAKKDNMLSHANLINASELATNDPDAASNPSRIKDALDTATYEHGAMVDENHPGLTTDENGSVSFDQSKPEGIAGSNMLRANIDRSHGIIWQNAIQTQAAQNPLAAQSFYEQYKDKIPPLAQARIEAFLNPKVNDYKADGIVNTTVALANADHQNLIVNPQQDKINKSVDFVMNHESDFVPNDAGKGPSKYGINQAAHPDIDVTKLTPEQAKDIIKKDYSIAIGSEKLSPQMALVATDSAVNMGVDKTKTLLAQAGNDPQKLIDLRRAEYQRLAAADPAKYGQYLDGWNNRLDDLQAQIKSSSIPTNQPQQSRFTTNPDGSPLTLADYYATHREQVLSKALAMAERDFPGNPTYQSMVRERVTQQMNAAISDQQNQYKQDNKTVTKAIFGELTNGQVPTSYQALRAIPNVGPVLDRVYAQDPKFAEGIDRMISQANRKDTSTNSPNGFETIMRTLEPPTDAEGNRNYNSIVNQGQLDGLLGKNDGTGINMKDYLDAKKIVEAPDTVKTFFAKEMNNIKNANGNIDGLGQQRALAWYSNAVAAYEKQTQNPDFDKSKIKDFFDDLTDTGIYQHKPTALEQIGNWYNRVCSSEQKTQSNATKIPILTDKAQFDALPSGSLYMRNGQQFRKP